MPIVFPPELMVSVSGFRGKVGLPLTPELVTSLAAGFGAFLRKTQGGTTVFLGRDSRTSGPMLARSAAAGLQSVGCDVVDLGMVPTPTLLLSVEEKGATGGICVTASHNPAEWNALKFASAEGMFLDAESMGQFQEFLQTEEPARAKWDEIGSVRSDSGAVDRHMERILTLPFLDVPALKLRSFRVALDCVNGAGGVIMPQLLQALGCQVIGIHTEPHGRFPRDPEPTATNLAGLGDAVRAAGADLGMAVDPDVDRLALVDGEGVPLGEDLTLALASAVVLGRNPGVVVTNLSTSQVVEDVARSFGGSVLRAPVGEINVARKMQDAGAVVGGEGNGGVILPSLHFTRDAPLGAALVLQHLLDQGSGLRAAASRWPTYTIRKQKIAFSREALTGAYEALLSDLSPPDRDETDGLRLTWPEERVWLHVRPSGTEPVVRLIAEAPSEKEVDALMTRAFEILDGVA
ncbi:MAG: phosphoglucosamine mutase [Longimicrobiales bacterium]|nr:phosphoglucosamine mutase [Longimicrobiales bacterium]